MANPTAAPAMQTEPLFREVQRFRQAWLWACVAGGFVSALLPVGLAFYERVARGEASWETFWSDDTVIGAAVISGIALVLMIGVALLFARAKLVVDVYPGVLHVRFRVLFVDREIPLAEIERAEMVTYDPMRDYGGWGLRSGPEGNAYNVSGDRGVRLTFARREMPLLLGSQRAEALAAAIQQARPLR